MSQDLRDLILKALADGATTPLEIVEETVTEEDRVLAAVSAALAAYKGAKLARLRELRPVLQQLVEEGVVERRVQTDRSDGQHHFYFLKGAPPRVFKGFPPGKL